MKTAHLELELSEVFDDDDSICSSQVSQLFSQPLTPPPAPNFTLPEIPFIDEDSLGAENEFNSINQKAWTDIKPAAPSEAPAKVKPKEDEPPPLPRLKSSRSFSMRNPRKALNKTRSSASMASTSSMSQSTDDLPDLETILIEKSRKQYEKEEQTKPPPNPKELVNTVDGGWLNRRDPSMNLTGSDLSATSKLGIGNLNLSNFSAATTSSIVTYESDESAVANSEEESILTQNSQNRRSIRHVLKKRRIEEPVKVSEPQQVQEAVKKKDEEPVEVRRSTRNPEKVAAPTYNDSVVSEDEDLFGDISDDDPTYKKSPKPKKEETSKPKKQETSKPKKEAKTSQEKPAKKSRSQKVLKTAKKLIKRGKKEKAPTTTEMSELDKSQEFNDYVLEFGIDRLENVPRINSKELQESESLIQQFVLDEPSTSQPVAASVPVNSDLAKLEKKIAAGSLNENFVTINLRKKVFVRGKKVFNFSRYKKSQWKKKKAAALCGPEMDMGGCDGGVLTCFQCGGVGHMARQCKAKGK